MTATLLERTPHWKYEADHDLTQWYGHVELRGDHAIGQWFCVEIETGRVRWSGREHRATTIHDVDRGVIVATEMSSHGPCTADFGVFGISVETGELLWTGPGDDGVSLFRLLVSWLPGLGVTLAGSPHAVIDGECFTSTGHVLDVATGRLLRTIREAELPRRPEDTSPACVLYRDGQLPLQRGGALLAYGAADEFTLERVGPEEWRFRPAAHGRRVAGDFYSWRLHGTRIFLSVQDDARRGELWELDARTGKIVAKTVLATSGPACRIEAVDDRHLLVSHGRTLWCFDSGLAPREEG